MSNQEHKFHKGDEPHELYEPLEGDQRLRQNGPHLFSIQHGPIIRFSHIEEQEELLPPRLELQTLKDFKDFKDLKDLKDLKDFKDLKDHKDFKDFKDLKDFKDCRIYNHKPH